MPSSQRYRAVSVSLRLLALALSLLLVACDDHSAAVRIEPEVLAAGGQLAPVSTTLRLAVPSALLGVVEPALARSAGAAPGTAVQFVPEGADANLRLTVSDDPRDPVVRRWAVVTAASRLDVDDIPMNQLRVSASQGALLTGASEVALLTPLLPQLTFEPVAPEQIPQRLEASPAALAMMPVDSVTVLVRALALDGMDPVRGAGDLSAYPLVIRARLETVKPSQAVEQARAALLDALARPEPPPLRVTFTGDLIPARCVYAEMRRLNDYAAPFRRVADRLSSADLTIGSMDAALSDKGTPIGCVETFSLLAPAEVVQGYQLAGFDAITIAANHAKDCGVSSCGDAAFLDTLARLRAAGIQPAGGGRTLAEARLPAVVSAGGVRFAILGYDDIAPYYHADDQSPGAAGLDAATLADDIRAAKAAADVVVVMPHWGVEYTADPTPRQRDLARIAITSGATMVVGNHPHVVQAALPVGDGYVAFGLGNFVFDQDWSVETTEGVVLEATFRGSTLAAVRFLPHHIVGRLQPIFVGPAEGRHILQRMMTAAAKITD